MRTGAIFFCAVLFLVAGCAEVPRPATFPYSFQQQLQSASHWELIAKSTIEDLYTSLVGGPDQPRPPIYVQSSDKSPFGRAYRTYLITELIKSGFYISDSPDKSISVNWSVQLIRRNVERRKPALPGLHNAIATVAWTAGWTAHLVAPLAPAIIASEAGALLLDHELYGTTTDHKVPHTELILTTMVTRTQGILAANSKTYYINEQDRNNYWVSNINIPGAFTSDVSKPVTFTAVNR